jgi:hypothetical protein
LAGDGSTKRKYSASTVSDDTRHHISAKDKSSARDKSSKVEIKTAFEAILKAEFQASYTVSNVTTGTFVP